MSKLVYVEKKILTGFLGQMKKGCLEYLILWELIHLSYLLPLVKSCFRRALQFVAEW